MIHSVYDVSIIDRTAEDMRIILRENHDIAAPIKKQDGPWDTGKDDFRVMPMTEAMDVLESITSALTILLLAIVTISLIVGGVGITNVMYVIVTERTPEIGLRKAVGANESDIMWQFLVESVLITLAGGIVGIIFGILISFLISVGAKSYGINLGFSIPLKAFAVSFFFSIIFGVLFGLYPARRASKMDPIKALGVE
ncbi:FtsX-like permease family protein [Patescibacteria group bacterium]|nr:FtsX-like permease family protein [Patescibacteria group bacterium]MBU4057352.1 FtsX-like permease family protein [Patescibacteria group bacterium]MBU4115819.1 FtsX-like permease family protein [Patescibacteria group bacterium]